MQFSHPAGARSAGFEVHMIALCLLLGASAATVQVAPTPISLPQAGVEVPVPRGWAVEFSDSDSLHAKHSNGLQLRLVSYPYQLPLDTDGGKRFAREGTARLNAAGDDAVSVDQVTPATVDGLPALTLVSSGRLKGAPAHVVVQRTLATEGAMVHLTLLAPAHRQEEAAAALDRWTERIDVRRPPADLATLPRTAVSGAGFESPLPEGWRPPLEAEQAHVDRIASTAGMTAFGPERCWVAIQPLGAGETNLLMACKDDLRVGVLDDASFEGEAETLGAHLFGARAETMDPGARLALADRLAVSWIVPLGGKQTVMLAVTPFEEGAIRTWAIGRRTDSENLQAALEFVVTGTTFTGPDGGEHRVGSAAWLSYVISHRPGLVLMACSPLLLGAVAVGWRGRRRREALDLDV